METLKDENVTIIFFGSRAREDFNRVSDIEIGTLSGKNFDRRKLILLKDKIEDLNIPSTVDIVNLSSVSEDFKERALREGVIWKH